MSGLIEKTTMNDFKPAFQLLAILLLIPTVASAQSTLATTGVSTTGYVEATSATGAWLATQTEAETGSNNDQIMTPLRVKQSITANASGIPAGAIMAFALTSCPSGWSEYTAARGRFLRGIDNGAGNDPAGTRAPGNTQADAFKSHDHPFTDGADWRLTGGSGSQYGLSNGGAWTGSSNRAGVVGAAGDTETRPKNVAVLFCTKN